MTWIYHFNICYSFSVSFTREEYLNIWGTTCNSTTLTSTTEFLKFKLTKLMTAWYLDLCLALYDRLNPIANFWGAKVRLRRIGCTIYTTQYDISMRRHMALWQVKQIFLRPKSYAKLGIRENSITKKIQSIFPALCLQFARSGASVLPWTERIWISSFVGKLTREIQIHFRSTQSTSDSSYHDMVFYCKRTSWAQSSRCCCTRRGLDPNMFCVHIGRWWKRRCLEQSF